MRPFNGVLLAGLVVATAGCATPPGPHDPEGPPGPCDIVTRIGHANSPKDDRMFTMDGRSERAWSRLPGESAVAALLLYVKSPDVRPLGPADFKEVGRHSDGGLEKLTLEREGALDHAGRMFRVQLFNHDGYWVPEIILVCQGRAAVRREPF